MRLKLILTCILSLFLSIASNAQAFLGEKQADIEKYLQRQNIKYITGVNNTGNTYFGCELDPVVNCAYYFDKHELCYEYTIYQPPGDRKFIVKAFDSLYKRVGDAWVNTDQKVMWRMREEQDVLIIIANMYD